MPAASTIGMKVMTVVISIPVGIVTKKAVQRVWLTLRPEDPARSPESRDVRWGDAIGWAALSGAGIVVAELMTQRSAQAAYRALTGREPPAGGPPRRRKSWRKPEQKLEAKASR